MKNCLTREFVEVKFSKKLANWRRQKQFFCISVAERSEIRLSLAVYHHSSAAQTVPTRLYCGVRVGRRFFLLSLRSSSSLARLASSSSSTSALPPRSQAKCSLSSSVAPTPPWTAAEFPKLQDHPTEILTFGFSKPLVTASIVKTPTDRVWAARSEVAMNSI